MEENKNNNYDEKLEKLTKNCELLKKDNEEYKKLIKKNEDTILILIKLVENLKKDSEKKFKELENKYSEKIHKLAEIIKQKKENGQERNGIINDLNNNFVDEKKIYENVNKMIDYKLKIFENNKNQLNKIIPDNIQFKEGKKKEEKKEKKKEEKNKVKNEEKKEEKKEEINEAIVEYKGRTLLEILESKLTKILFEQSENIEENDINELKKISGALIIRKNDPSLKIKEFFETNIFNYIGELNEEQRISLAKKKTVIYTNIGPISLLKNIETKNYNSFITEFREKYGITELEFDNNKMLRLIKSYNFVEMEILKAILKKLKYLLPNE